MYKEEYYDYSGKEGKWIKDELKKRGFHHVTISNFPADFFRMSKSQLEKLFEHASDAFISKMYDVPIHQIQNRRSDFDIKQLGCTINRMEREEETAQIFKEILRIVSNEYNNGNIPHTNSTPLNSEKEFLYMKATGIVRRIDDLGRVVIPKEIRRTMRIREGDPLLTTLTQIDILQLNLTSVCKRKLEIEEKRKEYEERERRIMSWLNS